jgi:hypothetical protein
VKRSAKVSFLSLLLFVPLSARAAQDIAHPEKASAKTINISGTVGSEGKTFVSDKGNRVWKVVNSDALVAMEGRHVALKARVNADVNEIFVSIVRLQEVRTTAKLDDVAFRR